MQELKNKLTAPFLTALSFLLLFFLFTKIFGPIPFAVNSITTNKSDMFTVEGKGEATGIPDTAMFSFGISKSAPNVEEAKNEVNTAMGVILQKLRDLGINEKDIKTTNYSVNPNYDNPELPVRPLPAVESAPTVQSFPATGVIDGDPRITGYNVTQNIEVKITSVDKANQALDIVTENGANIAGGITFVLDDNKRLELEKQAREEAITKAKDKAKSISSLAGIRLGRIINVTEYPDYGYPMPYDAKSSVMQEGMGGVPTELAPGENTIRVNVTIFYETL